MNNKKFEETECQKAWLNYLDSLGDEKINDTDYKFENTQISFQEKFLYKIFKAGFMKGSNNG